MSNSKYELRRVAAHTTIYAAISNVSCYTDIEAITQSLINLTKWSLEVENRLL